MNGLFYTLHWKGSDFRFDENLTSSENVVRIGQKEDCEVHLPNTGQYADECFAVIKPVKSSDGWQIISTSEYVHTYVNGSPVVLNHYLQNGDRISFSETSAEILFEIKKGESTGTTYFSFISRRFLSVVIVSAALIIGLAAFGILAPIIQNNRRNNILRTAEESILQLSVDSIYVVRTVEGKDEIIDRLTSSGKHSGTAFITTDGLLITARHCIEPWLNYDLNNITGQSLTELPDNIRKAIESETYNQTHFRSDTVFKLVSKCSFTGKEQKFSCLSSDFRYNDKRDNIFEFGDFVNCYYIRSINPYNNRADMMLGDMAIHNVRFTKGNITLPEESELGKMAKTGSSLYFKKYRVDKIDKVANIETRQGNLLQDYKNGHMISHSGGLSRGYSGGPVLMVHKGQIYAIGVISTYDNDADNENKSRIFSVPITEMNNILINE